MTATTSEADTWRRAPGVTLLGPVTGSGLVQETCLVERRDGQVVQLSALLNLVLALAATATPAPELARSVSDAYGRELPVAGLRHLIDTKLLPLGLVERASADAPPAPPPPTAKPLLALRARGTILPARAVNVVAAWLAPLFHPAVVVAALTGLVAVDIALIVVGDPLAALERVLLTPALLLVLIVLLSLGALIHELGHATACRYGGARPGRIGFGLYLVFPAYFTNVTDSYRLGRAGRLRTDLGGLYFNVWCVLLAGVGYLVTGDAVLLLVVLLMQLQMIQQLPPFIRLDGYFVLADLAGVPDLFSRVRPVLRSLMPGRPLDPRVAELTPTARRIVVAWVVTVIPLLTLALALTLWALPVIVSATFAAIGVHAESIAAGWARADAAAVVLGAVSILFLVLPLVGLALVLGRLAVLLVRAPVSWFARRRASSAAASPERSRDMTTIDRPPREVPPVPPLPPDLAHEPQPELRRPSEPPVEPAPAPDLAATALPGIRTSRPSFLWQEPPDDAAREGWRGFLVRVLGVALGPSAAERSRRRWVTEVSRSWPKPRTIAIVNGKGGAGKTVTTAMLAAVFARYGGSGVLALDNNDTRGTLGWRTESSSHDATIQDLLPAAESLLAPSAQLADLSRYVHHQTADKYDVLRSNPELLATSQRLTEADFDAIHDVATKYFRVIFFDSGNDESAPRWLRMVDRTDQLVIATTALGEPAESGALLLEALSARDDASRRLAQNAVVIVLRSERDGTAAAARQIADGYAAMARAVVTIPFDSALHRGPLRFESLRPATQRAWLEAAAAVATGL